MKLVEKDIQADIGFLFPIMGNPVRGTHNLLDIPRRGCKCPLLMSHKVMVLKHTVKEGLINEQVDEFVNTEAIRRIFWR